MRVAVLGATGVVGREMLRTLAERRFPADEVVALASPRSEGAQVPFAGERLTVRRVADEAFEGVDIALFSPGATASREWAPRATAAGATVVDNSSAFRMEPDVPLVIPEVNGDALEGHRGIVANPNCTAITALMAVAPLHRAAGLQRMVISSYQSVSGAGQRGIDELIEQVDKIGDRQHELARPDADALPAGDVFGVPIAYNVIPRGGPFEADGWTGEEAKLRQESRKILSMPDLPVAATVVRVPVVVGHSTSILVELRDELTPQAARDLLGASPGIEVVDDPERDRFPTPIAAAGRDEVLVGRIRPGDLPRSLLLFASADNLRKGAALNAVQIAERLSASRASRP